ncbi:hypothetical protein Bca52824_017902 [Brassica carinata]|uniref:Uncharacterized protein n=1 Tax=Brassica carinata TaxID=52824 RepID=A0A8X7VP31_BRACI|nr:hypothetical protein Bca52824_017902 [Brassica carinata]
MLKGKKTCYSSMAEEDISSSGSFLLTLRWKTINLRLSGEDRESGGEIVNAGLSGEYGEIGDAQWLTIAYESASSFALWRVGVHDGIQQGLCSV